MPSKIVIIGTVLASAMLGGMAFDIHLPVVPHLPELIGATVVEAQWTLAAYSFGFAVSMLLFGALGDLLSRRTVLLSGLALFVPASVLCALAAGPLTLVSARLVQGIAGAAGNVIVPPTVRSLLDEASSIRAMSLIGTVFSVVPIGAPALGAAIVAFGDWTLIFWILGGLGLMLMPLTWRLLPAEAPSGHVGATWGAFWVTLRGYGALLRHRRYMLYVLSQGLSFAGIMTFILSAPYLISAHLDGGAFEFIMSQVFLVGGFMVAANGIGFLVHRFKADQFMLAGNLVQIAAAALFVAATLSDVNFTWWHMAFLMAIYDGGHGMRSGPAFTKVMDLVPSHAARAAAGLNFLCVAFSGLGAAAVAPFLVQGVWPVAVAALLFALAALPLLLLAQRQTGLHTQSEVPAS